MHEEVSLTSILSKFINTTNRNIFLTGKAGTGKTTFLHNIKQNTHKNVVVAAPTGIAAINAGGVTLHSLFQLPFGAFIPDNDGLSNIPQYTQINSPRTLLKGFHMHKTKRNMLRKMELLIIDEVSMLRVDLLDAIDLVLRTVRRQRDLPFGGVQMLFIGDLLQLPPVVKDEEWKYLSKYYNGVYFFDAQVLQYDKPLYVELDKIYRQSDELFIRLLNNLRDNKMQSEDIIELNKHYKPDYVQNSDDGVILLTTHNRIADEKNIKALAAIKAREKEFKATIDGDFKEYNYPAEGVLKLKIGAQVMFIKNDYSGNHLYFNGKIGVVSKLDNSIQVSFPDGSEPAYVEPYIWENKKYELNKQSNTIDENVTGTFAQYPLKLAWAITVHKSQGLTFDKAIIDVASAFAPGQIYVALSRLRSLDGLILTSQIPLQGIPIDEALTTFSKNKQLKDTLIPELEKESIQYLQNFALKAYDFTSLIQDVYFHADSYKKNLKKSAKQAYKERAEGWLKKSRPIKDVADNFRNQIHKITSEHTPNYLMVLNERVDKSITYFEPLIKDIHDDICKLVETLKVERGVKAYTTELIDLSNLYYGQLQNIYKVRALIKSALEGVDVSKDTIGSPKFSETRQTITATAKTKKTSKLKKTKENKETKVPTKQISYDLYKQGKSIKEIANERSLKDVTIEGHLASYVESGDIDIKELVSSEKILEIAKLVSQLDNFGLKDLKDELGKAYSYAELRFVVAHLKGK